MIHEELISHCVWEKMAKNLQFIHKIDDKAKNKWL